MSEAVSMDPQRKVYFRLDHTVPHVILLRIQAFLLDGATGSVQLNIKDGEILGAHINEVVSVNGLGSKKRRTA